MTRISSPTPEPPAQDFVGRKLGDFRLVERIGGGGVGSIYRAEQVGLDRPAVVKLLKPRMAEDETARLRFLREARLASTLDHPYAAHVYAFGVEPDGLQWIAMELVRGTPLSEILRGGQRIPLTTFIPFIERFCQVVQTAHDHGIVHRDIKPQNVMVIERAGASLPKLLDLGLAKDMSHVLEPTQPSGSRDLAQAGADARASRFDRETAPDSRMTPRSDDAVASSRRSIPSSSTSDLEALAALTHDGDVMGSPSYMAPEQWEAAERVGFPADIYALGVLCFEAIAGKRPFGGTLTNLAEMHLTAPLPRLPPDVPKELHAVIARAMAKAPEDRPTSAVAFARDLRAASALESDVTSTPKLVREVAEAALRDLPQPIAEAVAEVEGARSAFEVLEAAVRLSRVVVRYLAVLALAAHDALKGRALSPAAAEIVSSLRGRRLEDDEWLELARALTTPFARDAERHPIPPLVRTLAFDTPVMDALATALRKQASTDGPLPVLAAVSRALQGLAFLADFPLAVVADAGRAELWTGVRRARRVVCAIDPNATVARGGAVVVCAGGRVVPLAPFALASRPSLNAPEELFLLEGRGRRGVVLVASPTGFEKTSEAALERLRRLSAASDGAERNSASLDVPYRGLAPLTAADADIFFGREREVEAFVNRLRVEPLLALVGPSGAGKSSFVRAGVVPSLDGAFHAMILRPGSTPLETLRAKLVAFGVDLRGPSLDLDVDDVAAKVHEAARARDETLVIVVDQFEEAFTLTRDAVERARFCAWLMHIARTSSSPARVVLTLRDDFLVRAQQEAALENRLAAALELLAPLADASLRRILIEPARRAGFTFESDELVDAMVAAVVGHAGALALLSFAASKLWEQRNGDARTLTSAAYDAMGGVGGALARHAEAVLERLTSAQRTLVRSAFRRLVTADGTRAVTAFDELLALLGNDDAARVVIERLVAARLLVVAEADDGTERIEIIHEALLSAWPRLVEWQREDAAGARFRDQIQAAARAWSARGKPRDLLWRDALVDEYLRWREANPKTLTPNEEAFCIACVAEKNRGRRLRTGITALFALAAGVTSYVAIQENVARKSAQSAIAVAEAANRRAEQSAFRARDAARLAAARTHTDDPTLQLALLREVEAQTPLPDWAPSTRAALHGGVSIVLEHPAEVIAVAYAADGRRVLSGSMDYMLRIWNVDGSGEPRLLRGHTNTITSIAVSPDGRRIASGSWDGTVRVWNDDGSGEPVILRHPNRVLGIAFSADGQRIASASRDNTVRVWNADGSGDPWVLKGHTDGATSVAFSPDGRTLASASSDKTMRLWPLDAGTADDSARRSTVVRGHGGRIQGIAFSPDGTRIVTASEDKTARLWSVGRDTPPVVLEGHGGPVYSAKFSPDGRRIATASFDATVRLWDAERPRDPAVFRGHSVPIYDVAFAPDGQHVASASEDKTVRIWNVGAAPDPLTFRTPAIPNGVAFARDGSRVGAALDDTTARVFRLDGTHPPVVLRGHTDRLNGIALSPDGRLAATSSYDRTVRIWKVDGDDAPRALVGHTEVINGIAFSPDSTRLVSASQDRTLRVWTLDDSAKPVVQRADDTLNGVAFSADGERVAAASKDGTVLVWDARHEAPPTVFRGHTGQATGVAFRPDGRLLASSSFDGTVRLWPLVAGVEPRVLRGHTDRITGVSFSADGETLASSSMDKTVHVWKVAPTGDALASEPVVLRSDNDLLLDVALSPDGQRVVTSSADNTVRVFGDLAPLTPSDPRLWQATNLCPSVDLRKQLLGIEDALAESQFIRCRERVAAGR